MITQVEMPVRSDPAWRMAQVLQAIKDKETTLAQVSSEFRNEIKNLYTELDKIRMEVLTGQGNLLDVMTEISHERPNGNTE